MKAVRPYTIKGRLLCATIQGLAYAVHIFKEKKWEKAVEFEENPRTMDTWDIIYFAYKYYFKPPFLPSDPGIIDHFKTGIKKTGHTTPQLTISIGGDLMPYEMIKPENTLHLWDKAGSDFFGSDIVFANLETPLDITKKPHFVPEVMLTNMLFNTNEATFKIFSGNGAFKGYDILSIANNHSLDMGEEGLLNTIRNLNDKNIKTVGAVASKEAFDKPAIIEKNGIKTGFIAYTYSLNQFETPANKPWLVNLLPLNKPDCDISLIKRQAEICKKAGADIIICSLHAGNAYQVYPGKMTVDLFERIFAECGVDIIAGGHPHNLQPWRNYSFTDPFTGRQKTGFAIYSLADFIAYDIFTWCHLCAYVKLEVSKDSEGEISINPIVKPLVMGKKNKKLQLKYAENVFSKPSLTTEEKDLKVLYDECVKKQT